MWQTLLCAAFCAIVAVPLQAADQKTATKPDDVRLTWDSDDIEFCSALGEVKAKSGWGGSMGSGMGIDSVKSTLRKRAAALGANVLHLRNLSAEFMTFGSGEAYACSEQALLQQQAKAAEIARKAAATVTCNIGTDCEVRWSRVTLWLQAHSDWKFRNVTDTLITTEGPFDTVAKPAFEVTKVPTGDGKTYRIAMRAFCGKGECQKLILKLKANFYDDLTAPLQPSPGSTP